MSFATPFFLLFGLLAGPIILMYMLRLRRREIVISSTMLWQKLLRDREANTPWQRLRRNLLLILQLLILTALAFALARPFLPVSSVVSGNVVVLLDGSASMLATDVEPNRFIVAREEVEEMVSDLGGGDQMTIILVGQTPQVLISAAGDKVAVRQALAGIEAKPVAADWEGALALAAGVSQGFRDSRIVIVSDGGLPVELPLLPAEIIYLPVGISAENMAISALAPGETPLGPELFAAVTNYGRTDQQALVSIELDGVLFDSRRVTVPAGDVSNLSWTLPSETTEIAAHISGNQDDYLALDDMSWAVREARAGTRALLVGETNRFLDTALSVLPGIEIVRAGASFDTDETIEIQYDLLVLDGVPLPEPPPDSDLLIIDPVSSSHSENELFYNVTGVFSKTAVVRVTDSPLNTYVDWSNINILRAKQLESDWLRPNVMAEDGPLLLAGEQNGRRVAILTFKLQESDLPLQIAFPVLMANITSWLNPGRLFDATPTLRVGDPVPVFPRAGATAVIVALPDGNERSIATSDETVVFDETKQLGLYRVTVRDLEGDRQAGSFAVNLFASAESAIAPAETLALNQLAAETATQNSVGQRELWPWLAALSFAVLFIEWWVFHRGSRLPNLPRLDFKSQSRGR